MRNYLFRLLGAALFVIFAFGFASPSRAETGQVAVVFTKGGFIIGVGGGQGVLVFHGRHYRFTVSGMSVGFTIGASTSKFVGRALNLSSPGDSGRQPMPLAGQARRVRRWRRRRPVAECKWCDPAAQRTKDRT